MKKQLLHCCYLILPLASVSVFSEPGYAQEQVSASLIKYQFSVQDVSDAASAKEMTDYIRPLFNTEEKPFVYFPWYNSTSKQFEFESVVRVSETELAALLNHYGLVLTTFNIVLTANTAK